MTDDTTRESSEADFDPEHAAELARNREPYPSEHRAKFIRSRLEMWEGLGIIAAGWTVQHNADRTDWDISFTQEIFDTEDHTIGDREFRWLDRGRMWGSFEENIFGQTTLLDVDQVFFDQLASLKKWGAIESWGVTDNGDDSVLVFTIMGRETIIQPHEVEDTVSALMDGWLAARAQSCAPHQLHQEERRAIERFNAEDGPHGEDQAAIDYLERPASAGEDDPDRGGEDD